MTSHVDFKAFSGQTALITGASSGLGLDFARQLVSGGANVILVARREGLLKQITSELSNETTKVTYLVQDLTAADAVDNIVSYLSKNDIYPEILINNAGFGVFGHFDTLPLDRQLNMIDLNIKTLVNLTAKAIHWMKREEIKGYILQVSSIGGFMPSPLYATYSATKAFVLSFGEALNFELRRHGINHTTLCPGITATEFFKVTEQKKTLYQRIMMMSSDVVVRKGLKALYSGKSVLVPGFMNKLTIASIRLTPRFMMPTIAHLVMKN